jgi:tRNA (guanine-N7-)-methyltransferase
VLELVSHQAGSLDLAQLVERPGPVHVDLGCGDGSFLRARAAEQPEANFIGIERLLRRVCSSNRKASELGNVRIIRAETMFVLRYILPPASVETFYLLFPDPWPKRRHHRRRIVTAEFLGAIHSRLTTGGSLFIATDDGEYFQSITRLARPLRSLAIVPNGWRLPATTFERKFIAAGAMIHRLELRKISPLI